MPTHIHPYPQQAIRSQKINALEIRTAKDSERRALSFSWLPGPSRDEINSAFKYEREKKEERYNAFSKGMDVDWASEVYHKHNREAREGDHRKIRGIVVQLSCGEW